MKSLKTKVIMSAFVLVFALIATIGSTYAWFTVSNTVTVSSINVEVVTQESLLIRVYEGETEVDTQDVGLYTFDGTAGSADSFVNTISTSLITASPNYTDFESYLMLPVTAANTPTTGDATDYTALGAGDLSTIDIGTTTSRALTSANFNNTVAGGYIQLKFWLMVTSGTDVTVELDAFTASGTTVSQALYLAVENSTLNDAGTETQYAIDSDWGFVFGATDTGYSATGTLNSIPTGTITTLQGLEESTNAGTTISTLTANIPELITVSLWIEGWDAEATNSLMGDSTDVTFSFQIFS